MSKEKRSKGRGKEGKEELNQSKRERHSADCMKHTYLTVVILLLLSSSITHYLEGEESEDE